MPDTSAAGDSWSAVGTALTVFGIGLLTWIGRKMGAADQAKSPVTPLPEAAGVTMTLIDQKTQAEIARDTERTALASEDAAETLHDVRDIMRKFIEDAEEARDEQEKRDLRDRADKAERERERMERMLEDSRRNAGPYTTAPRSKDLLKE